MKRGYSIESFPATIYEKCKIFVCRDTLYAWAETIPEFSDSRKIGDAAGLKFFERRLAYALKNGMKGWPTAGWVFTMKNRFRWRDNPHEDAPNDDRPTFSDLMKSIEKHDESNNATKKKKSSKRGNK